jgi:hypothetical protein
LPLNRAPAFTPNPLPIEKKPEVETTLTTYLVEDKVEMSGGRSEAGTIIEERKTTELFAPGPPPPPPGWIPPPPPGFAPAPQPVQEVFTETKIIERSPSPHHHHHHNPIIMEARPREESTLIERHREVYESSDPIPVGPLALALPAERHSSRDERAIRAEIKALEAEKEALRAQKRADRDFRKADRIRRGARHSESDLVLYERDTYERPGEEVTLVRRERIAEPEGGVRIEKDRKGRMAISVPKYIRD